jgi:hypothetical protein
VEENLRVPLGLKRVAEASQLLTQFLVVVDLAVEDEMQGAEMQGLVRTLVEVDYHQPPNGEARHVVGPDSLSVGAALPHRLGHSLEE